MNVTPLHTNPGTRVLIAHENPIVAFSLESMMHEIRPCEIRTTTDPREVQVLHAAWPFELLVLDMHSELFNGFAVIDQMGHAIRNSELTLVALVDQGDEQMRRASLASGAVTTITEPLDTTEAVASINRAFSLMPARSAFANKRTMLN